MNTHLTTSTLVMVVAVTFYACFLVPRLGRVLAVLLLGGISAFGGAVSGTGPWSQ